MNKYKDNIMHLDVGFNQVILDLNFNEVIITADDTGVVLTTHELREIVEALESFEGSK